MRGASDFSAPEKRALEEVLGTGERSIRNTMGSRLDEGFDYETIEGAMTEAGVVVCQSGIEDTGVDPVGAEREGGDGIGVMELAQLVAILETEPPGPALNTRAPVQLERASILLHQAWQPNPPEHGPTSARSMARRLEATLQGVDPSTVSAYLWDALADLATALPMESFDAWMDVTGPMIRRAVPMLIDKMTELVISTDDATLETLWPHIVDAFLLSLGTRPRELDGRIYNLPADALGRAHVRLGKLRAFGMSLLKPGDFKLEQTFAYSTILSLMASPLHVSVGPVLLAAFRETMPADPGVRACLLAHRTYNEWTGWVAAAQLAAGRGALAGDEERSVAWCLLNALTGLPQERRQEQWVPEAIEWLGARDRSLDPDAHFDEANAFFDAVMNERIGPLRRAWSKECRQSAAWAKEQWGPS